MPFSGNGGGLSAPFLEIITRHMTSRPSMLAINQASLKTQTAGEWCQTLLIDEQGLGVGASYVALSRYAPKLTGRYIWILDDDDYCIRPQLVEELKAIAADNDPDVIMMRMDHGPLGVKPEDDFWQRPVVAGRVGCSAYVVKREVWQKYAHAFLPGSYQSDYWFIASIFADSPAVYWFDVVGSKVQRISNGAPE